MEEPVVVNKGEEPLDLPPGFRFHPTDEEIITYYLTEKVMNSSFGATAIGEADFNKCEPWDLPKKAKMGEKDWYFFCQRDRKYPTGTRTNRATQSGYWKATGKDKEIYKGKGNLVGMKKTLVFYTGRAPNGEKTNWVMHEFRLEGKFATYNLPKPAKDGWVVSRVFHRNTDVKKTPNPGLYRMNSFGDDLLDFSSLPPLMDPTNPPSDGNYLSTAFINNNNNQHQMPVKPQHHMNYEIPTSSYATDQGHFNNLMGSTLSQPPIRIQNPSVPFQENMLSDYCIQQNKKDDDNAVLRAFAATRESISGMDKPCKMEQFSSNHSLVSISQDTCLSNDKTTDSSSAISKQLDMGRNGGLYEDLEGPSSVAPLSDLEYLWDDY